MNSFKLTLILHPSIRSDNCILEGSISGETTILDGILSIIKTDDGVANTLILDDKLKPGHLLISNKIELKTTGKADNLITSDMEVRIIPISHGG